jgi:hypothetical protein
MQCIYTYIPETNHVPREHRVAAILVLLFMVLISLVPALTPLYLYVSTSRSVCAVPNMAVVRSSVISCLPSVLLRFCLNDFQMVPVAPITTSILFLLFYGVVKALYYVLNILTVHNCLLVIIIYSHSICFRVHMHYCLNQL